MANVKPVKLGKNTRMSFAGINEVMQMPNLIEVQKNSYKWFLDVGLREVFRDIDEITDYTGNLVLTFIDYRMDEKPKYSVTECKERDATYAAPLRVIARLYNKETGEIKENEVYMGDFPIMTDSGTFVLNGAERVIISQLVRSPGVYFGNTFDKNGKKLFTSTVIPNRGAWLEYETDQNDIFNVRIDKNRKLPITTFIRALGLSSNQDIRDFFGYDDRIEATLEKDTTQNTEEALLEVYKKLRPGEPPTLETAQAHLDGLFFDPHRYDISRVGRYKYNKKLAIAERIIGGTLASPVFDPLTGELLADEGEKLSKDKAYEIDKAGVKEVILKTEEEGKTVKVISNGMVDPLDFIKDVTREQLEEIGINEKVSFAVLSDILNTCESTEELLSEMKDRSDELVPKHITIDDIFASINYLNCLGNELGTTDDIDHLGNRRIRSVGELLQNQFRIGFTRMERVVRERMTLQAQEPDKATPAALINIRPVIAAIKEFFGSSPLSQFMDQTNPLAELTHKRRLSALGPGGLSRDRAGFEVRDVHYSHYGRMCPIETPEGPNIGLIGSLALYARVNEYGFIEAPFRRVENGVATDQIDWMTADEEEKHVIAPANTPLDPKTNEFITTDAEGKLVRPHTVIARTRDFDGSFGAPADVPVEDVDYMDVSPRQMLSVAATLIPFLEHDDAKRTLMGANMQRQAVPLVHPAAPYVGTGMERRAALDSGEVTLAKNAGEVIFADAAKIIVKHAGGMDEYHLAKYQRSNQSTCINHRPLVNVGDTVVEGEPIADGPSTDHGELALGQNLTVAYMPWEGFNYEDGIVVSERLVAEDLLTTINITRHEIDARDTKLGPEEITREIPNLSEDMLANLDEDGIIRIGAEVGPGDILVGKVTPKGESALTAEERLLRAIFGAKAHDVRDTSLKMPHGAYGRVIDVVRFSRENGDDLAPGVNEQVRVYVAQRRKIQQGDKIAGRHGNKGVICNVLPVEDMPYMADGTPIDVILNPLGVPSRMNVGQLLECHLGWAAACGWDTEDADSDKYVPGPFFTATPVFDGAKEDEIAEVIRRANKNMLNKATAAFGDHMRPEFVTQLDERGKTRLFDGRTGEEFREPITVGTSYILKLGHMVDDKIHARSTGPYSLVTQQPLGGKAQFGGQRFGEMEVWALYAYGASNVLQEILTVKSDDTVGRVKTYESIVKGENVPVPGIPESFKVLVKEIRSLALDIEPMHDADEDASAPVTAEETSALDDLAALAGVDADVEAQDAETAEAPEAVAATTTDKE